MSHKTSAKIITDSITPYGESTRLTSIYVIFPKMILSERNRHRGFSLSDRSSRAIPPEKLIAEIRADPAMPAKFRRRTKGMGGGEELTGDELQRAISDWNYGADAAANTAQLLLYDLAKETVNRPLDPYIRMHSLMTATRDVWLNFFGLRLFYAEPMLGPDPTIEVLARKCFEAYKASTPKLLKPSEWHLPFVEVKEGCWHEDGSFLTDEIAQRLSAARCAHLSYNDLETGKKMTIEKALKIYDKLVGSQPMHLSPLEHQACVDEIEDYTLSIPEPTEENHIKQELPMSMAVHLKNANLCGNFALGWIQARKLLPNESVAPLPESYSL